MEGRNYAEKHKVVFKVNFLIDDVPVEREVVCATMSKFGNTPGIWCFKLRRNDDTESFTLVETRKASEQSIRNAKTSVSKQGKREAVAKARRDKWGVDGIDDHDELDEDAPAAKARKDFCMRLIPLKPEEAFRAMEAVFCVVGAEDGRLRVTKEVGNDRIVCATVTSNPKGLHDGFKPLAMHFPDELIGIDVVLTGRNLVVDVSDGRVIINGSGFLELSGHVFGKVTETPVDRCAPPSGFVFAKVFGLMGAISTPGLVNCRYLRYLTEDPEELAQMGSIAARLGRLDIVERCVSSLQTSILLSSSLSSGYAQFRCAISMMLQASLSVIARKCFIFCLSSLMIRREK